MAGEKPQENKLLGENGYKYKERFGVIIICTDENHQRTVYEKLLSEGYKLKVVCV